MAVKTAFIESALKAQALKFGEFTLKSGRISPYFFNAGHFFTGRYLREIGDAYAATLIESNLDFDTIFGPAYKGIPLSTAIVMSLAGRGRPDVLYSCNRKEKKTHGDVGNHLGAEPKGRCVIADDVITAGTSFNESVEFIKPYGGTIVGGIIMVNRQEVGQKDGVDTQISAIQEIEKTHGFKIYSIIGLDDILTYAANTTEFKAHVPAIEAYRERYGVAA